METFVLSPAEKYSKFQLVRDHKSVIIVIKFSILEAPLDF